MVTFMQMHRFYCENLAGTAAELVGSEAHHLANVLRLHKDDKVELFDGKGTLSLAAIENIARHQVTLRIESAKTTPERKTGRIIIAASIAKGERFDWLIAKCTELGADRICPIIFERTVKLPKNPRIVDRWLAIAIESAKQCKRLHLPRIDSPAALVQAIPALKAAYPAGRLVFGSPSPLSPALAATPFGTSDVIAFIGPEGGLTDNEIRLLMQNAAQAIRLTDTILRIETAALAFAAILTAQRNVMA